MDNDIEERAWYEAKPELEPHLSCVNELKVLYDLHHNIWSEQLLHAPFLFYYQNVLWPKERQIVDCMIKKYPMKKICKIVGVKESTIIRSIYTIRYVFRNKTRERVNVFWNNRNCKQRIKY